MLRVMWRRGDSSLRRIYPSWEDLEANLDIVVDTENQETEFTFGSCPYCGAKQRIEKPKDEMFPYTSCHACKRPFHVNHDLTVRKLTEEEKENMPAEWVRIMEDLNRKKLAVVFRLE
jgi:hypothetical protein